MLKVLLISQYIAPVQAIGAVRWTKILKYLKKNHDVHITVVTSEKDFSDDPRAYDPQKKDALLEKDMQYFDEYWEVPAAPVLAGFYSAKYRIKSVLKKGKKDTAVQTTATQANDFASVNVKSRRMELYQFRRYGEDRVQARNVVQYLKNKPFDFDVMISSFGPAWTFMAAAQLKKRHPEVLWFVDFRDPYPNEISDSEVIFRLHKNVVKKYCAGADVVLKVQDDSETYTGARVPRVTCSNGYDPEEARPPLPPEKFSFVLTGTVYAGWSEPGPLFRAIKELCDIGDMNAQDITVDYAGIGGKLVEELARDHGVELLLENYGVVPREKAIELQQKAAILYQGGSNTQKTKFMWTGKSYEYMMANKPIIYIVAGDVPYSLPSRYMQQLGGCCYEVCRDAETYPPLRQYILEKYREWKATGNVTVQRDEDYVRQFAYPEITEGLWKLIQEKRKQA